MIVVHYVKQHMINLERNLKQDSCNKINLNVNIKINNKNKNNIEIDL